MKKQAEKLRQVEVELSGKYGDFDLFALFLREDAPNKWDLMISSDWARADKRFALNAIVEQMKLALEPQELMMLSRIIILERDDAALAALHDSMRVEHGVAEISDGDFFGLAIKHAYIITSKQGLDEPALHQTGR